MNSTSKFNLIVVKMLKLVLCFSHDGVPLKCKKKTTRLYSLTVRIVSAWFQLLLNLAGHYLQANNSIKNYEKTLPQTHGWALTLIFDVLLSVIPEHSANDGLKTVKKKSRHYGRHRVNTFTDIQYPTIVSLKKCLGRCPVHLHVHGRVLVRDHVDGSMSMSMSLSMSVPLSMSVSMSMSFSISVPAPVHVNAHNNGHVHQHAHRH